jgi:hypothetical protein
VQLSLLLKDQISKRAADVGASTEQPVNFFGWKKVHVRPDILGMASRLEGSDEGSKEAQNVDNTIIQQDLCLLLAHTTISDQDKALFAHKQKAVNCCYA